MSALHDPSEWLNEPNQLLMNEFTNIVMEW